MADSTTLDSVYPSPALVSLAKHRKAGPPGPTSEPPRDNDCLYAFKCESLQVSHLGEPYS